MRSNDILNLINNIHSYIRKVNKVVSDNEEVKYYENRLLEDTQRYIKQYVNDIDYDIQQLNRGVECLKMIKKESE